MNGIYVHIPFCIKKCAYCDFVSYENRLGEAEAYVDALLLEMEAYRGVGADTVYIGGGTPTALPPHLLVRLLDGVRDCFSLADDREITVEANPGTCSAEGFARLAAAGVNRISLGAQSFLSEELTALGRIHTAAQTKEAVVDARRAGIVNISLDLMFSLPGQTLAHLAYSLEQAAALEPSHISCYGLTLCEGTPLHAAVENGRVTLPDDDTDRALYAMLCNTLHEKGYSRYEISNFAKPGCLSRHNVKYWSRSPYIGLGAAAHSFYGGRRFENPPQLSAYYRVVRGEQDREGARVTRTEAMAEFMFLGLRMTERGVLRQDFFTAFGTGVDAVYAAPIQKLCALGLLEDDGDRLRLTERGIDVSNTVFCEFL